MQKICNRCHFVNPRKRRICQSCGGKAFAAMEDSCVIEPMAEQQPRAITTLVRGALSAIAEDATETAHKSARAYRSILRLLRGA